MGCICPLSASDPDRNAGGIGAAPFGRHGRAAGWVVVPKLYTQAPARVVNAAGSCIVPLLAVQST